MSSCLTGSSVHGFHYSCLNGISGSVSGGSNSGCGVEIECMMTLVNGYCKCCDWSDTFGFGFNMK